MQDLRDGRINGVLNFPPDYSRRVLAKDAPQVALIEDNTDNFAVGALEGGFSDIVGTYNQGGATAARPGGVTLSVVEIYPYVPYIQYLLSGSIVMAIFVSAMIGGGIIYIDDKARGLHEGYLVTPISKLELILGFNLSGAAKAVLAGIVLTTVGSVIAGIPNPLEPIRMIKLILVIVLTSLALISMMFFLMVRVNDPLVPRAMFGVLNTLLYFPSGAVYPIYGFPPWMRVISMVRSLHLRRACVQIAAAEEHGNHGHCRRPDFPDNFHPGDGGGGNRPFQAHPLIIPLAIRPRIQHNVGAREHADTPCSPGGTGHDSA